MKKIILLSLLVISFAASAQENYKIDNNQIVVSKVIENTGLTEIEAYNALSVKFSEIWNDSKETLVSNNEKCIAHKGYFKLTDYMMGAYNIEAEVLMKVDIKDNRVRITISSQDSYVTWGGERHHGYSFVDVAPLGKKRAGLNINKKKTCEAFEILVYKMNAYVDILEKSLQKNKEDNEW